MTKKKTTTVELDVPTLQQRREMIELVACDGLTAFGDDPQGAVTYVLQAICVELMAVSMIVEDELQPANLVTGAMLGGLFGIGTTATDETVLGLHHQAVRLRAHIARLIGLPVSGGTLAEDEAAAAARREAARPTQERIDQLIENLDAKVGR